MIADPYKVLGVEPSATDAELKKAYREMSKKYHPDANPDNPKAAEEKFKEVQEAYRQIQTAKEQGTSPYGSSSTGGYQQSYGQSYGNPYQQSYGSSSYGQSSGQYRRNGYTDYDETSSSSGYGGFDDFFGFGGWNRYSGQRRTYQAPNETNEMRAARNYINSGYYNEAINALNSMDASLRNAQWYYLHAIANSGIGNNIAAEESARKACSMEPSNSDYADLLQRIRNGGDSYEQRSAAYNRSTMASTALCLGCCALNAACTMCGRDGGVFLC